MRNFHTLVLTAMAFVPFITFGQKDNNITFRRNEPMGIISTIGVDFKKGEESPAYFQFVYSEEGTNVDAKLVGTLKAEAVEVKSINGEQVVTPGSVAEDFVSKDSFEAFKNEEFKAKLLQLLASDEAVSNAVVAIAKSIVVAEPAPAAPTEPETPAGE